MWWLLSVLLLVPGVVVFGWLSNAMGQPWYARPLILHRTIPVAVISIGSLALLVAGLYSLWHANTIVFLVLVGIIVLIMGRGALLNRTKSRASRFFRFYRQLQIYRPQASQKELIEESIRLYLKGTQQEQQTESIIRTVCKEDRDLADIKRVVDLVFALEDPNGVSMADFDRYMKQAAKREKAISQAYEKIFAAATSSVAKPKVSADTLKRMKDQGFDPDTMSNEQLAALETMEDPNKSHWFAQIFTYGGFGSGFLALIQLLALDILGVILYVILSVVLLFFGYKIQSRIAANKFHKASIQKWAEEQRATHK